MIVDFHCGPCDSSMMLNTDAEPTDDDTYSIWLFIQRWSAAHVECGWVMNAEQADGEPGKLVLGPDDLPPQGDEQEPTDHEDAETLEG